MRGPLAFGVVVAAWFAWGGHGSARGTDPPAVRVSRAEMVAVMREQTQKGYDVLATANGARFTAGVLLRLASLARGRDPRRAPLLLDHQDYFDAFTEAAGIAQEAAPAFIRVAREYGEDQFVDYRRERVIERIVRGREPVLAVNVVAGWPGRPGAADQYSYEDNASKPPLRVIHKRITSYRLLDLGDVLVFDEIRGIGGRATGGLLGLMFRVIGDGQAVRSFAALGADGVQVTRTTARKAFITVTQTATVSTSGRGEKGLPPGRPDLLAIERHLEEPFEAKYPALEYLDPAKWR